MGPSSSTSATPARVAVVGSINMDLVVRAPKLPAHGETVLGGSYRTFPGGKGANQAVAAARFGAQVVFIGRLGDDAHGAKLRETLGADGVDCAHLLTSPGASGLGMITVADDGENTIVVASGANALMSAEDVRNARKAIEDADVLLMQLEIPMAANAGAIEIARSAGRSVILNTAPARALGAEVLACVDVLVMNRSEAASLVGVDPSMDPARISLRLPDLRVPLAVLTLGALGSIMVHKGRIKRIPTPEVKAVDAVGAGDAFVGTLAASWSEVAAAERAKSHDAFRLAEQAVLRASAAGAIAATRPGAIPSMPRRDEVIALAATLRAGG